MLYRRFGRTNLQIPVLSCGGMRYQHKWQDTPLDEIPADNQQNLEATIHRALELGINHIETARGYGSSERQLGEILPLVPRDKLIVQTKVSASKDTAEFRANVLDSLKRLKLDYVDLFAIHGINDEENLEWATRKDGCLAVARELQRDGLLRNIGFSTHALPDVLMKAITTEVYGGFDYVNLHWYYIFQKNWPCVEEATRRDMGVFIISPSDKGGMLYNPPEKMCKLTKPLHPIEFNDVFCLSRPQVHTLSIGAARPTDFDLHVRAVENFDEWLSHLPEIEERLETELARVMGNEYARRYDEGLPDWRSTPGDVNIPTILWLLNMHKAWGLTDYAKMRYNLLGNAGHWFPGKNAADIDSIDLAQALESSPFKLQIPLYLKQAHEELYTAPVKRLSESE